jgi:hypothetical protein
MWLFFFQVHSATVPRSGQHEVRVPVSEGLNNIYYCIYISINIFIVFIVLKGALLCYEFWSDDYDVGYGVAFCAKGLFYIF